MREQKSFLKENSKLVCVKFFSEFWQTSQETITLKYIILKKICLRRNSQMILIFQLFVFALILISFLLVVGVPVVLASPDRWSISKNTVFTGVSLWIGLVFLIGILNSFIA
jgi:photosystem II PsbZ protein